MLDVRLVVTTIGLVIVGSRGVGIGGRVRGFIIVE